MNIKSSLMPQSLNIWNCFTLKTLGPGLMMAGAAIGVSHLVQSTRAGAEYGYALLFLIVLTHILKYPFFEFGHRYAAATGQNLIQGYRELGRKYLYLFFILNILTAIISIAGVTFVTAALSSLLLPNELSVFFLSLICVMGCASVLLIGHYKWLDRIIKIMMALLVIVTFIAFTSAWIHGPIKSAEYQSASPWSLEALPFLIALMGWMPAPIELSVWQSLWLQAKQHQSDISFQNAKFDFNLGYFLTAILAVAFLMMGALIMHGSDTPFSNSGPVFAGQLVDMYTTTLGDWTKMIIVLVAMSTMLSTTMTVIDAYPRSLATCMKVLYPKLRIQRRTLQSLWTIFTCAIALFIIHSQMNHFKQLIDLATTIAFLAAPLFAWMNYRLLTSKHTPLTYQPGKGIRMLSQLGMVFLIGFSALYLVVMSGLLR